MRLSSGTRLGPYEIVDFIGSGGMGEVYLARDLRLARSVAIKILPPHLANSPEFRQRFDREARAISAISHPNICTLHDVGEHEGLNYLVMEYLDGETLASLLSRGPMPLPQLLRTAREIAEALATAHERGVLHRDLKPSNIILTPTGAKLLDFGLARDCAPAFTPASKSSQASTSVEPLTAKGTIVGTCQYMSPEQLNGREADVRSDVFSFGAVLYEMATGRQAFEGVSSASIIAAVLEKNPPPPSLVRSLIPLSLQATILRCLEKDPARRWQCARDLACELCRVQSAPERRLSAHPARLGAWEGTAWVVLCLLLLVSTSIVLRLTSRPPSLPLLTASVLPPEGARFAVAGDISGPPVISPDGRALAFAAVSRSGSNELFLRPLASSAARPIAGTEHAVFPFWSADSRSLGFFADGKLKRVDVTGGAPVTLCPAGDYPRGGTWSRDGTIIFAPEWQGGLSRVPASGGTPVPVTRLDESRQSTHRWPFFLPDGRHFVYVAANNADPGEGASIFYAAADGTGSRLLLQSRGNALFAAGYLLFVNGTELLKRPLDAATGVFTGEAARISDEVLYDPGTWHGIFTVSEAGVLVYEPGGIFSNDGQLLWIDRGGRELGLICGRDEHGSLRLSSHGRYVAFEKGGGGQTPDVWTSETVTGEERRITTSGDATVPVWLQDDRWIAYSRTGKDSQGIYRRPATGISGEELLLRASSPSFVCDGTADGRFLLFVQDTGLSKTGRDLWLLPLNGDRTPRPLLQTRADEAEAQLSPDGRWIAYTSNESGRGEVYVAPFPGMTRRWVISVSGGASPRWRGDGKELFYLASDGMIAAAALDIAPGAVRVSKITPLFHADLKSLLQGVAYDVAPDGQRLLVNRLGQEQSRPFVVVQNWPAAMGPR